MPLDLDKEQRDPSQEVGDNDKKTVTITLAIVFSAFIISPMTECLGPVLELNVRRSLKINNKKKLC